MLLPQRDICYSACSLPWLPCSHPISLKPWLFLTTVSPDFSCQETGRLEGLGVEGKKCPSLSGLGQSFPLERLWPYFVLMTPFPALVMRPFSILHCEKLLGFPKGKHMKLWGAPETTAPRHFSRSDQLTLSQCLSSKLSFGSSDLLTAPPAPAPGEQILAVTL